jgi:hypothetical protein
LKKKILLIILTCNPDINIVIETDANSEYKFINNYDNNILKFISGFEIKNKLSKSDTIENIIKYKFYVTNRVSYFLKSYYNFPPINHNMLQTEDNSPFKLYK